MASRESTGRELSSEWSHHRISSIDSKVRVTLQNPLKHSGSKRVKLKESMYIKREKPDLNQQVKHINLTLSL